MGGSIGVPDVGRLPIQSDVSQYNLRNASAAFTPQATPPPGAMGPTLTPDQSIAELEQNRLQTFLNPPQPQQPDFSQFQQPGPDLNDPLEQAKQVIVSHLQASQQANANRGSRIKNILSNFFHGAGEAMMLHAGLPTPEMQRQRDLTNLLEISNAQSNQGLRQAHEGLYRLQSQMADRQMPDGRWIQVPIAHVGAFDAAMARIQAAPDKAVNPQQATFEYLTRPIAQGGKGLTADAAYQLIQKQPADISPDRETFNYLTRPKEQGGLGLNPSQAYGKMHPRQNLTMGTTPESDVEIVQGMLDGTLDVTKVASIRGNRREALIAQAKKADPTFNMATYTNRLKVQEKFTSGKAADQIASLNTFSGHVADASDLVDGLRNTNSPWLNRPMNAVASGMGNDKIAPFQAAIEAAKDEYLSFLKGGHAPQQAELELADKLLNANQTPAQIQATLKQMAQTVLIRAGSLNSEYKRTMNKDYPLLNADAVTALSKLGFGNEAAKLTGGLAAGSESAKPSGPPPGATMKVTGSDGKKHWSDGKQDLGLAE